MCRHAVAGIYNDLGSGSNVDLCIITKEGVEYKRNLNYLQGKLYERKIPVDYDSRPRHIIKEKKVATLADVEVVAGEPEAMEED
jgi:20S proteasome subunit beta 2